MTQHLKFGDRVKYGATDFLFIHDKGDGRAHVVSETGVSGAVLISNLTLISHPDTVRLDWLIENQAYVVHELPNEDCAYFSVSLNAGGQIAANSTARQAIDNAMREKAA